MDSTVPTFAADEISTTLRLATPAEDDMFKCEYCPRTFTIVRGRSKHQTAHGHRWAPPALKKARIDPPPASSSGKVWRHVGGRAPVFNTIGAHYCPWACFLAPSLPSKTGVGLALVQQSSAVSALFAGGSRQTGDGGHRGVDQEETTDGIDLTLRL